MLSASTEGLMSPDRFVYHPAWENWSTQDQSTSVTSAGAVPAASAVTTLSWMESQARFSIRTLMPVLAVNRASWEAGICPQGGSSTVMVSPAYCRFKTQG